MRIVAIAILSLLSGIFAQSASAREDTRGKHRPAPPERECTPINGRYGYYGNPWCDTGSTRPPDIEFRSQRKLNPRGLRRSR
ncbi:hypothetical protein DLM45_05320 [Hyphomicrobium methylovorum]|uniref:hypothetical protein n=1 Tax=Hyphomicrobium methylovorum TaxID=84 RepID=UPI0015E644EC|nr:hypothetical protein [Hyphomicrobium methylovorum]MBA2125645.1 hypothetical protein [Hyphomicrobium methylovorum]